ncbi:MAG: hypothetical protein NZ518_00450 [Dehalococcoidia bacterium]|nr:hypothetical protein [Dehalococcoidia bacterium]
MTRDWRGIGIGTLTLAWKLFRETSFTEIDDRASRPVAIAVLGGSPADRQAIVEALSAGADSPLVSADATNAVITLRLQPAEAGLVVDIASGPKGPPTVDPAPPIALPLLTPEDIRAVLAPAILARFPDEKLALARRLPAMRGIVAQAQIAEISLGNLQFAVLSNLPDVFPVLGDLIGSVADLLLLTKNQVMLVYQLAAIYGRPLGSTKEIVLEIVPVLGGAFVWRAIARRLASVAPFGLGIVPKVAIAYVGTYVTGQVAAYYFDTGRTPPKELSRRFVAEAWEQLRKLGVRPSGATHRAPAAPTILR